MQQIVFRRHVRELHVVSILTGPFGPVQRGVFHPARTRGRRFNPHRPFRAGATWAIQDRDGNRLDVSILTGPFGPVQQIEKILED